ncbi:uncharacterized protein TNCV_4523361 [Trichonephila clavipes]|nr:uncharacterized protein TNCV_4523361 [Trichonephila clavipes]
MIYSVELNAPKRHLINLANVDGNYNCQLEVLDEKKICASLPRMNDVLRLNQLKDIGIFFSDAIIDDRSCLHEKNSDGIHLLIGADYAGKLFNGKNETSLRRFGCCTHAFGVDSNG